MREQLTLRVAGGTRALRPGLRWSLAAGAVTVACLLPLLVLGDRVDRWAGATLTSMAGPAGVFAVVVALLALDTVLPVPSSILATAAGYRLGFAGGTVAIGLGLCAGNGVGYLIGRLAGTRAVERMVGSDQLARARTLATSRPGLTALAVTRPVPVLSEATVVLAGAARARAVPTLAVCALANVGVAVAYAGTGSAAHGAAAAPLALAGSVGLPALALLGNAIVLARKRKDAA